MRLSNLLGSKTPRQFPSFRNIPHARLSGFEKRSVALTTAVPHHRFIRLKNVKASNNLRDVYLRSIFIGGQEYELYEETNKTEIARAILNDPALKDSDS